MKKETFDTFRVNFIKLLKSYHIWQRNSLSKDCSHFLVVSWSENCTQQTQKHDMKCFSIPFAFFCLLLSNAMGLFSFFFDANACPMHSKTPHSSILPRRYDELLQQREQLLSHLRLCFDKRSFSFIRIQRHFFSSK